VDTVALDDIAHLAETHKGTEAADADPIHLRGQQFLITPGGIIAHTVCRGIAALQLIQYRMGWASTTSIRQCVSASTTTIL